MKCLTLILMERCVFAEQVTLSVAFLLRCGGVTERGETDFQCFGVSGEGKLLGSSGFVMLLDVCY